MEINEELNTTYKIGRHIQEQIDGTDLWSDWKGYFKSGPNPFRDQTKQGFILQEYYGMPSRIHTCYGAWHILGSGSGDWSPIMESLKEDLGLKMLRSGRLGDNGYHGPLWKITKFKDIDIPKYISVCQSNYKPYEECKQVWKDFVEASGYSLLV